MKVENPPTRFIHCTLYGEGRSCRCTVAYQVTDVELVPGHDPLVVYRYAFGYCSPKDAFNRKIGREKAAERLASNDKSAVLRRYIGYQGTIVGLFLSALEKLPPVKQGMMGVPFRVAQTWDTQQRRAARRVEADKGKRVSERVTLSRREAERRMKTGFSRRSRILYHTFVKDLVDPKDKEAVRRAMHQVLISNGYASRLDRKKS